MLAFCAAVFRRCLSLRYSVETHGTHLLKSDKPLLILPNHVALVDPQILFTQLYKYVRPRPVIAEKYADLPVLKYLFRAMGVIAVRDIDGAKTASQDLRQMMANIVEALGNGDSVVLYPAGQLAGQGKEAIFGKQSAWATVSNLPPEARVIGVRIRGLWGSMWSRAWIGKSPPFFRTFLRALFIIPANGVFFVPRREVSLEFEDITKTAMQQAQQGAKAFNGWLESFYNREGEERVRFIRHFFYLPPLRRDLPRVIEGSLAEMLSGAETDPDRLDPKVLAEVCQTVAELRQIPIADVRPESHLVLELGFDSLGMAELAAVIKARFPQSGNVPVKSLKTVGQLCLMAEGKTNEEEVLKECDFDHFPFPVGERVKIGRDLPIAQQIIRMCREQPDAPFLYDATLGTLTRKEFFRKAAVVSHLLRQKVPEERVGIMLPAVASSTLLVAACYLAGKVPVMFNWTVGAAALEHSLKNSGVRRILTAKSFFAVIADQIPKGINHHLLFVENIIQEASPLSKLAGLTKSFLPKLFLGGKNAPQTAVILFTSGSEALPKTVPLTQKNIIADLWGTFERLKVGTDEKILSFLPPFHSFGFTATVILPLLAGIRAAYTPDPTDARMILRILKHTRGSVLLSTPTFLRMILAQAGKGDFASLRLVISGAEACPADLVGRLHKLSDGKADFVEGYGITECSPVVTINPREKPKKGSVGRLIEGLFGLSADHQTLQPLSGDQGGMVFVRGESVFDGYIGEGTIDPFVEINGNYWYKTGDLGYFDEEGYLFLTGRLSRFLKIGGEMVSLPFLEKILLDRFGSDEETVLAVEGDDRGEKPMIVLFTILDIPLEQANQVLKAGGVANLLRISEVRKVDQIPVLGTGKTDYKVLKNQI